MIFIIILFRFSWKGNSANLFFCFLICFHLQTRVARHEIFGYNFHILYQIVGGAGTNLLSKKDFLYFIL